MTVKVKVRGLRELTAGLNELPRATQKSVVRRVLKKAAEPMEQTAESRVPVGRGVLKRSISIGTKLSKRQARLNRRSKDKQKGRVQVFVGPGAYPHAHMQEFGTDRTPRHPFMRPAFEGNKNRVLMNIRDTLKVEIDKAAVRMARKAAKIKAQK